MRSWRAGIPRPTVKTKKRRDGLHYSTRVIVHDKILRKKLRAFIGDFICFHNAGKNHPRMADGLLGNQNEQDHGIE
jgi:hypothetical protein